MLYIIFRCNLHVGNITKICGYSNEKYNGYRNIYFIRLYAWSYFPFNSRLGVRSTSYLNSPGYEAGFRCVEWCVKFVGTEVGICLVLVTTPSYFLYFAKAFIYSRRSENTQKYWYSSCRIEIIFRFKLLDFS